MKSEPKRPRRSAAPERGRAEAVATSDRSEAEAEHGATLDPQQPQS